MIVGLEGVDKVIDGLMDAVRTLAGVAETDLDRGVKGIEEE